MKKLSFTSLAFVLAIGASSLGWTKGSKDFIDVKGKHASCPTGQVSYECSLKSDGPACTFDAGFPTGTVKAVPKYTIDCANALILRRPY